MTPAFVFTIQTSTDKGRTWLVDGTAADERGYASPEQLASDVLDATYRSLLEGTGSAPVPLVQVQVYSGSVTGIPLATSSIGTDRQWEATHDLLAEISADIKRFEEEKKQAEQQAASAHTAIGNAKQRLESVTKSAIRMKMPQVDIAHGANRSREWVRRIQGGLTTGQ
ncbi:hypothetical protein [Streptomyces sp. H27-S2]|uniref:hypothetical protein n=1 Tax=Streptomyces antarcticus TaxID=2996458 RepID=UPI0022720285|nr:hypothetical protein [Streptomyces sp. H27-S2]MCY0954121.1 hypothetical protein [Streptomyces sp. H27-S2]